MIFSQEENSQLEKFYNKRKENIDIEYEVKFKNITYYKFESLLKFLKFHLTSEEIPLKYIGTTTSLDIIYHDNSKKQIPLRHSINNPEDISKFCKTNELLGITPIITYKKRFKVGDKWSFLDIDNYNIRVNLKNEIEYNHDKKGFISHLGNLQPSVNNEWDKFNNLQIPKKDLLKTFRLKNRFSFMYNGDTHIDLTIVKSSKDMVPVKEFIDSNIINEDKTYEIEIEFHPGEDIKESMESFNTNLKDIVTIILQGINDYPIIIPEDEKNVVKKMFQETIKKNHVSIISKKLEILSDIDRVRTLELKDSNNPDIQEIKDKWTDNEYFNMIYDDKLNITSIKKKYNDSGRYGLLKMIKNNTGSYGKNKTYFIGPKPVSLEL